MANILENKQQFEQTSDTLVLHASNRTTDFLIPIYNNKNWDVLRYASEISIEFQRYIMEQYDRIVMMGHGTAKGLLGNSYGLFNPKRWKKSKREYAIDSSFVDILQKVLTTCIWCHADKFVPKYNLSGLYTGRIISEVAEATDEGLHVSQSVIDESNSLFTESIKQNIDIQNPSVVGRILDIYDTRDDNPVIQINKKRIYYR